MPIRLLALAALCLFASAGVAAAKCNLEMRAQWPVTVVDGRALVPVTINGKPARLFIDTGAFFSTLTPDGAQRLGLHLEPLPPWLTVRGATGAAQQHQTQVRDFALPGFDFGAADLLVSEHGLGAGDGLVGQNVLGRYDLEFDLANGVMRLFEPHDCSGVDLAYWRQSASVGILPIQPITPPQNAIVGDATLNGAKIRVVLDTGAARSVLSVRGAQRAGVRLDGPGVQSEGMSSGVGRRLVRSWVAPFDSFEIGGEKITNTRMPVADVELSDEDMMLGIDFFLAHRVYIARSQDRIYFTYNGGPVFRLDQPAPAPTAVAQAAPAPAAASGSDDPSDAAGYERRAAASESRHAYAAAIDDYSHAIALAPTDPKPYYERGLARVLNQQQTLAIDDFDQALKLKPDDAAALVARAALRIVNHDIAGARADYDAAAALAPDSRLNAADSYAASDLFEDAVANYDKWIAAHPKNEDAARAYGARCFTRALWGHDLDKALSDCNQALDLAPGAPQLLASRGLVRYRLGDLDRAIADDSAAIRLQPRSPWALYGRGLAELRKGQKDAGEADLAAARTLAPKLTDHARLLGLTPQG